MAFSCQLSYVAVIGIVFKSFVEVCSSYVGLLKCYVVDKSYVGVTTCYIVENKSYLKNNKSYIRDNTKIYVGLSKSYVHVGLIFIFSTVGTNTSQ